MIFFHDHQDYRSAQNRYTPMGCSIIADTYRRALDISQFKYQNTYRIPVHYNIRRDIISLPTLYADIQGKNAEDAYVINDNINFDIHTIKSYGLQFMCENPLIRMYNISTRDGDDYSINPFAISSFDRDDPNKPLTITLLIATIKNLSRNICDPTFLNSIRVDDNNYMINCVVDATDTYETNQDVVFQTFKKINIYKTKNNEYNVYIQMGDQYILDAVRKYIDTHNGKHPRVTDIFDTYNVQCYSYSDIHTDYTDNYYVTNTNDLDFSCNTNMHYIKFYATLKIPSFEGLKLYTLHGYKGVSTLSDFKSEFPIGSEIGTMLRNIPGLIVANNVAIESRALKGEEIDMKRNFSKIIINGNETALIGYTNYIVSSLMQPCQAGRLKFDTQTQMSLFANGLTDCVNSKYADNIYNRLSLTRPDSSKQILDNYNLLNIFFRMDYENPENEKLNYGSVHDIDNINKIYNELLSLRKSLNKNNRSS